MCGRVGEFLDAIAGGGEHYAVAAIDQHRADRHFTAPGGTLGFGEC